MIASFGWQGQAACRGSDPGLFFGPDIEDLAARQARETKAKRICSTCVVQRDCYAYASVRDERYGVWGGVTEDERRAARRNARRRERSKGAA